MERKIIQTTNRKYGAESLRSWYSLRWSRNSPPRFEINGPIVFKRTHYWALYWANRFQYTSTQLLILSFHHVVSSLQSIILILRMYFSSLWGCYTPSRSHSFLIWPTS